MSDSIRTTSFRTGNAGLEPSTDPVPDTSSSSAMQAQVAALQGARQSTKVEESDGKAMRDGKHVSDRGVTQAQPGQEALERTRSMSKIIALAESLQAGHTLAPDITAQLRQALGGPHIAAAAGKSLDDEQDPTPDRVTTVLTLLTGAEAACSPAAGAEMTRRVLLSLTEEVVRSKHHEPALELLLRHALQCAPAQRSPEWLAAVMGQVVQILQAQDLTLLPTVAVTLSKLMEEGETGLAQVQATASAVLGSVTQPYDTDQLPELLIRLACKLEPHQYAALGQATARWAKTHLPDDWTHVHCRGFLSCIKGFLRMGEHVKPPEITAFAYGMNKEWPAVQDQKRFAQALSKAEAFDGFPAANGHLRMRAWDVDDEFARGMNLIDAALDRLDSKGHAENGARLMKVVFAHGLATDEHLWAIDKAQREGKMWKHYSVQDVLDLAGPKLEPTVRRMAMTPGQLFAQAWTDLATSDTDIESKSASHVLDASVAQRLQAATDTIEFAVNAVVRRIGLHDIARQVKAGASAEALQKLEPQLRQHRAALQEHIESVKVQTPPSKAESVSPERLARWRELCIAPLQAYVDMIDRIIGADKPETKSTSS